MEYFFPTTMGGSAQMIRGVIFLACTLLLVRFSWKSLGNAFSHGFYRFFAFEGILLLLMMNQPYWFRDPFSPQHLLSWLMLFASLVVVVHALLILKREGGHDHREDMPENLPFENTVHIVETGPYQHVRHPMYSSLLLLGWGAFLKHITPVTGVLILLVCIFLIATAQVEEKENIRFFGPEYREYMHRTKMFIPWLL